MQVLVALVPYSPYKLKYAEDLAFWILEALQKTNTPKFHKFKANYLSKRGLKWLTQILSWFSPKNEGSVAPISKRKQKCTQALVTFQYVCSRGGSVIFHLYVPTETYSTQKSRYTSFELNTYWSKCWTQTDCLLLFFIFSLHGYTEENTISSNLSFPLASHCINYLLFIILLLSTELSVDVIQGFSSFTMSALARRGSLLNVCIHSPGIF